MWRDVRSEHVELKTPTWGDALPFVLVGVIGLATLAVPSDKNFGVGFQLMLVSFALTLAVLVLGIKRPVRRWPRVVAPLLTFAVIGFARDVGGGADSGLGTLVILPLLWVAVTGRRLDLVLGALATIALFVLPILLVGEPDYPAQEWRRAVVWVAFATLLAPGIQAMVQELARAHRALAREHEQTERLITDAPHGIAVLDTDGRIVRSNAALRELIGAAPGDLEGRGLSSLAPPGDGSLARHLEQALSEDRWAVETNGTVRDARGRDVPVVLTGRSLHDTTGEEDDLVLVHIVDASERRRYEERLAHIADHDVLTGLPNRRRFDLELQRHVERCERYGPTGAILLLDLDNFKQVNDSLGHRAGDDLLVSVAELLQRGVRRTDLVGRVGGDEFAVLLTEGDEAAAEHVAASIVGLIREYADTLDGVRRRVSVSIGVVTMQAATEHKADVLALADMTMYDAKEEGRNRYAMLREGAEHPPRSGARLEWQERIERALEQSRFELLLQPILDLRTDQVRSAEVLLRLPHAGELVPPGRFLYIAERAGLMPRIDAWVIDRSAALLARLREVDPGFELEVNLSGHSLGDPLIETALVEAVGRHDVDPSSLILEITETAAVADVRQAREFAERMSALGCKFALDDFGAGFGSFYYLKHLLFDYVKIDGEFVAGAHRSVVDRTIVSSIVGIARNLGKQTVAEFVSDPETLAVVREEGVDLAQGYLIGAPMSYDELAARFLT